MLALAADISAQYDVMIDTISHFPNLEKLVKNAIISDASVSTSSQPLVASIIIAIMNSASI